ncbi:hypothetical protein KAI46_08600 [bacterium]|nr:hypothetical protein [bacterium]
MKKITKRDEQIYQLRKDGYTFTHIASLFDISNARAQKIYQGVKYLKEEFQKLPSFEQALSPKSKNALMGYFKDSDIFTNPEILVQTGREKLLSIQNIGIKNIKEITEALYQLGYIDYDDPWLENHRDKSIAMFYISPERRTIYNLETECLGKWRITEMDLWDQDYVDMDVEGYFNFQEDNIGDFQFSLVQGAIDYRIEKFASKERLEFSCIRHSKLDSI